MRSQTLPIFIMPLDIEKLGNLFGQDTIKKIYEDGASLPVKETGKMLGDLIKTFRLFTAPIQLLAAYQDRLSVHLEKVRKSVMPENQIEAPASIAGPILERLKYLEDNNYLTELYLNLLSRAIDKERVNEAHPAFYQIIDQLSSDEAILLYFAKNAPVLIDSIHNIKSVTGSTCKFADGIPTLDESLHKKITIIKYLDMYVNHLRALNLVEWKIVSQEPLMGGDGKQTGVLVHSSMKLTDFGSIFVNACIPDSANIME